MKGLSILTFEGKKHLVFIEKKISNNINVCLDINGNTKNFHSSYLIDLSDYPDKQVVAYRQFPFASF